MQDPVSTLIPNHKLGTWLLTNITGILDKLGLSHERGLEEFIYVCFVVGIAIVIGWVLRYAILWLTRKIVEAYHTEVGREMLRQRLLGKCSHIIPPLVILILIPFAFDSHSKLLHIFKIGLIVYTIFVMTYAVCSVLTFIWMRFDKRNNTKNLPLQGILNITTVH